MGYVERCLYEYKANMALIETLREELENIMSVRGHSYEAHQVNGKSDPVSEVTAKILSIEGKIKRTEKKTKPVKRLCEYLTSSVLFISQMREILEHKYFGAETVEEVKRNLNISYATYWRRKLSLLKIARKYFGEEE